MGKRDSSIRLQHARLLICFASTTLDCYGPRFRLRPGTNAVRARSSWMASPFDPAPAASDERRAEQAPHHTDEGCGMSPALPLPKSVHRRTGPRRALCLNGMIITAQSLARQNPTRASRIRQGLHGNLCRCGAICDVDSRGATWGRKLERESLSHRCPSRRRLENWKQKTSSAEIF